MKGSIMSSLGGVNDWPTAPCGAHRTTRPSVVHVSIATYRIALRRRLALLLKGEYHPHPSSPANVELSPSLAHARALDAAPLQLSWGKARISDPVAWQAE